MSKHKNVKTKNYQILLLFFFSLILIEIILRGIGFTYLKLQKNQNLNITNNSKIILCIGESTTALGNKDSYPFLLQEKLEKLYGEGTYKVINEGMPGSNSLEISKNLKEKIDTYKPHMIISMVGINDKFYYDQDSLLEKIKLLKLFRLIYINYFAEQRNYIDFTNTYEWHSNNLIYNLKSADIEYEANRTYNERDYKKAAQLYQQLPSHHNASEQMLWNLATISSELGEKENMLRYFENFLKIRQATNDYLAVAWHIYNHYSEDASLRQNIIIYLTKSIEIDPNNAEASRLLGIIYKNYVKDLDKAESIILKTKKLLPCSSRNNFALAKLYYEKNEPEKAMLINKDCFDGPRDLLHLHWLQFIIYQVKNKYYDHALQSIETAKLTFADSKLLYEYKNKILQIKRNANNNTPSEIKFGPIVNDDVMNFTARNYIAIAETIKEANIKHIVMQYPTLKVDSIKSTLADFKDIIYVDNHDNFNTALKKFNYDDIFYDRITASFGHATNLGNSIIVDSIIETLKKNKIISE